MNDDLKPTIEMIAFMELKSSIVKLMFEFTYKYGNLDNDFHPHAGNIMIEALQSCLQEAKLQDKQSNKKLSDDEKAKNIVAFLTIVFGESSDCLESLMQMSPQYLVEKFERYILSERPESDRGLHPILIKCVFEPYCDKYGLPYNKK